VTMDLTIFSHEEKLGVIRRVRALLGVTSFLILASFGSTFILSLGLSSPEAWVLGAVGYGGAISWGAIRGYYLARFVYPRQRR